MGKFNLRDLEDRFINPAELRFVGAERVDPGMAALAPFDPTTQQDIAALRAGLPPSPEFTRFPLLFTQVRMPAGLQNTVDTTADLVSGEIGGFRDILEGEQDMEQLQRLQAIENRNFQNIFLPNLESALSGGPMGAGFNSGARDRVTRDAFLNLADSQARQRFEFDQAAKDRSLQAASLLPSMASVQDIERQNKIQNLERAINTHFGNEEGERQAYIAELAAWEQALAQAGLMSQEEMFYTELETRNNQFQTEVALTNAANALKADMFNSELDFNAQQVAFNQYAEAIGIERQLQAIQDAKKGGFLSGLGSLAGGVLGAVGGFFGGGPAGALAGAGLGASAGSSAGSFIGGNYTQGNRQLMSTLLAAPELIPLTTANLGRGGSGGTDLSYTSPFFSPVEAPSLSLNSGIVATNSGGLTLGGGPPIPAARIPTVLTPFERPSLTLGGY